MVRDTLENMEQDPVKRAQKHSAPELPKRFYKEASLELRAGELHLLLDGKAARTPGKKPLCVAHETFADRMVGEWSEQGEFIDPAKMPYTRLANSSIDGVASELDAVAEEIAKFANSDLLFYRASRPEGLVAMQERHWDPVLQYIRSSLEAKFVLTEGLVFVEQPRASVERIKARVELYQKDALALAGLQVMTAVSGSVLIALRAADGDMSLEAAWDAAHVDEDWNISEWGTDAEAEARRAYRWSEFQVAHLAATSLSDE